MTDFWKDYEPEPTRPAPVQEPVAFFCPSQGFYWAKPTKIIAPVTVDVKPLPLYINPPAQPAPVQEPVAITEQMAFAFHNAITDGAIGTDDLMDIMRGLEAAFAHIIAPPAAQRQWVGLTDEEKRQIFVREGYQGWLDYINAIEAKLKEKNNG
jgi:hypothetical protein